MPNGRLHMSCIRLTRHIAPRLLLLAVLAFGAASAAAQTRPFVSIASRHDYATTVQRIDAAIAASPLGAVTRASATKGAAAIGKRIPGNMVIGVFAPGYAVRMLSASVDAGFEAPVRLYIVEAADGKVTVRYRKPSVLFAPYANADLDAMARELDDLLEQIVASVR